MSRRPTRHECEPLHGPSFLDANAQGRGVRGTRTHPLVSAHGGREAAEVRCKPVCDAGLNVEFHHDCRQWIIYRSRQVSVNILPLIERHCCSNQSGSLESIRARTVYGHHLGHKIVLDWPSGMGTSP